MSLDRACPSTLSVNVVMTASTLNISPSHQTGPVLDAQCRYSQSSEFLECRSVSAF